MNEVSIKPIVWIIDAEQWPRAYLRAELMERGFEVIGFERLSQSLEALRYRLYEKPFAMVIELLHLALQQSEISALACVQIPKILLAGALELNEAWVEELERAVVIKRPFTIGDVADAVESLRVRLYDRPDNSPG